MDIDSLAEKSAKGNRSAFAELYDALAGKIHAYFYYRTLNRDTAEDLTQTVFLKALEKLDLYSRSHGSFVSWLYAIAHNTLVDHYRSTRKTESLDDEPADVWDSPEGSRQEIDAIERDRWERLAPKLSELTPDAREILVLRVWDDLAYSEIAKVTGKSENACKMSFSRSISRLKELMPLAMLVYLIACAPCSRRT